MNPIHAIFDERPPVSGDGGTMVFTWCKLPLAKHHEHLIEAHIFKGYAEAAMDAGNMDAWDRPLCQGCADALGVVLP